MTGREEEGRRKRKRERESKRGSVLSDIKMTKMQLLIYFLSTSEKERDTQRFGLRKKKRMKSLQSVIKARL